MYQFVMWGLGVHGRRFLDICPSERVVAVIDSNPKLQGEEYKGIPIISYEEYLESFKGNDILVTVIDADDICNKLSANAVRNVFFLKDCPPEIKGACGGTWVDKLPIEVGSGKNVIYGLNLYSILLREYLAETKGLYLDIIPEEDDAISKAFADKYPYVVLRKPLADETVLWASGYPIPRMQNRVEDIFDFKGKIEAYKNPELRRFKDIAKKKRCFLIGNGPSLRMEDLDTLQRHGEDCFGVNGIYKAFPNTCWKPKYYLTEDRLAIEEGVEHMRKYPEVTVFYGDYAPDVKMKRKNGENVFKIHSHMIMTDGKKAKRFSTELVDGMYFGGTVIYGCMQIAAYMGYKEIYLLGVDHSIVGDVSDPRNHFTPDYFSANIKVNPFRSEDVENGYRCAKSYADAHGISIYNATRGGELEVFERVNFDSLFSE